MRAALYLRTSTTEQSTDNQRPELEQLATARGWILTNVYEEQASAAKARPQLRQLLNDAHRRSFDVLLVWSLDRLGRSMMGNVQTVLALDQLGVRVVSFREPWLDSQGPVRELLVAIFGWIAQQEREQLVARTKAGLDRARKQGKTLGRPRRIFDLERALELKVQGLSVRQLAQHLRVPRSTLDRVLRSQTPPQGGEGAGEPTAASVLRVPPSNDRS